VLRVLMLNNRVVASRLDLVAAKARILAEDDKNNSVWEGDLARGLSQIESEVRAIQREINENRGWEYQGPG